MTRRRDPSADARGRPLEVLWADERLVCVHKPAGLLCATSAREGGRHVVSALREQGLETLPVHRLDREVSGALLLALDPETQARLVELLRERSARKTYWGLVAGVPKRPEGELSWPILEEGSGARVSSFGKPALTRYRTLAAFPSAAELELDLVTGRRNQLRLHLAHLGHPLLGERKYARGKDSPLRVPSRRVALHARSLALPHPWSGEPLSFEAPLPPDLEELRQRAQEGPTR